MPVDPAVIHAAADRGDHVYPYASYQPITEATTQPTIVPWNFILHTMAGPGSTTPTQLRNYVAREDVNGESHLIYGYTELIQVVPFNVRADNNAQANSWMIGTKRVGAVSVETQDNGSRTDPGIAKAPWNDFQVEHLAGTAAFLNLRYGIPLERCRYWNSPGVDGHRAHAEWSVYVGKTCPGQTRWEQIPHILNLAAQIVAWTPEPQEPDMPAKFFRTPASPSAVWVTTDDVTAVRVTKAMADARIAAGLPFAPVAIDQAEAQRYAYVNSLELGVIGLT